ncbi:TetR/AcrR family transcriptional regulator [Streptomyces sp. NPDC001833]|uniref:TetR/AcrR family transcriptional regulator n=1 Tax=Streptomyces sp. NPDC001833 TaxID=3154658 RepID=UPI00332D4C34
MSEDQTVAENRQVVRRKEAERRLLDAAAELIAESGPARITLADIGERAGYSRGLATHHFGSKGALIQRLVDTVTTQFTESLPGPETPGSSLDTMQDIVTTYFDILGDFRPINRARIVLWADAVASGSPEIRPAMLAMDGEFREALIQGVTLGIATGELPASIHADGFATVVIAMLRGVALQYVLDDQLDLEAARLEVRRFVLARLDPSADPLSLDRWEGERSS